MTKTTDPKTTGTEPESLAARDAGFADGLADAGFADAGFADAGHVPAAELGRRYFSGRADGLRPPGNAEELLVATA